MCMFPRNEQLRKPLVVKGAQSLFLLLIVSLILISASARSELAWSASSPTEITVVYSSFSGSSVSVWIAQERGLFTRHGLKANVIFATGRQPTQALALIDKSFIEKLGRDGFFKKEL